MTGYPRTSSALDAARAALVAERGQLLAESSALHADELALAADQRAEGGIAGDAADVASDLTELQVDEAVEWGARQRLADVDEALHRLESGRYGQCEDCGQSIDPARLRALPWARRCLTCQRLVEGRS